MKRKVRRERKLLREKTWKEIIWITFDTGELTLRHLIQDLDGPIKNNNRSSGPLGNMENEATQLEINAKFPNIKVCPPIPALPQEMFLTTSIVQ